MSSWERSRFIPWDRIPLPDTKPRGPDDPPPVDLDTAKERIIRQLQREVSTDEVETSTQRVPTTLPDEKVKSGVGFAFFSSQVQYSHMDFLKSAAFGGTIGTITGGVFGFMDGMRTAGESPVLQKASTVAKGKYLLQGTSRSATLFGIFFGGFHVLKYGLRTTLDPGEYMEICMVAPLALGAIFYKPAYRQALPYASMLILMDGVNIYMKKTD